MTATISPRGVPGTAEAADTKRSGWLHLCNGLDPRRDGGMVPSILGMTGALATSETPVTIVTSTPSRLDGTRPCDGVRFYGPERAIEEAVGGAEVVHLHGLWQKHTRRGARAARAAGIPYLMTLHGMADPWALRQKSLKKSVYRMLVEGKNLRRAACLHALSRPEIGHLRRLTRRTPICLVPNGVDLGPFEGLPDRTALEADHPELVGKFVLLFFGRLHAKKGLDLLAKAFAAIRTDHPHVHLLVAGNDDGSLAPFLAEVESAGMTGRVTCLGHVSGEKARRVWGRADAFILPSYSEGFSMAVLEALAARLPVMITTACHFPELAGAGGGVVVDPDVEGVTSGLRELIERNDRERDDLAARGRTFVESQYTWGRIAERLADVYRWVAGGGPPPAAVVTTGGR